MARTTSRNGSVVVRAEHTGHSSTNFGTTTLSDATPSRLGQIQAAGAADALWLKIFSGEVLTAYEQAKKLKRTVRVRQIANGKSAQFPATFNATADYHTPGAEILGNAIEHNEVIVTLDDMLISNVFIALIDELKNHYDVRAPYSEALGRSLALLEDRTIAQNIAVAARDTVELFNGDGSGSRVVEADITGTGDFDADGADLVTAINLAKQALDERDVPVDTLQVHSVVKPAQWYLIANTDGNLNRDYNGGEGSTFGRQSLRLVSDVIIYKSNAPLFGVNVTPTAGGGIVGAVGETRVPAAFPTKYHADLTETRGLVYCEPAVAYLQLLGLQMESGWDMRRQGTLMLAKMAIGMGKLRSKCAVEIATV